METGQLGDLDMDKLTKGWVQHQRKAARLEAASRGYQCPFREAKVNSESEAFKAHYSLKQGVGARKRRAMSGNPDLAESSSSDNAPASGLIRQPDTRPITSDQLRAEVEEIYAGLALLESKCIEYDASQKDAALDEEQYGPLIFLHRSLLDRTFPPASQHPSANGALQPLNSKRNVRHGPKVDGEAALANADTGSDIDVVSLEYAKRRGWAIHDLEPDNRNVELSDGSIVQLAGYVSALLNVGGRLEKKI